MTDKPSDETLERLTLEAEEALQTCSKLFGKVEGATKLKKRILSELKFLQSLKQDEGTPLLDVSQVQSSNMRHLLGILHVATSYPDVTHVLKTIQSRAQTSQIETTPNAIEKDKTSFGRVAVTVDVICNKGNSWVKVIARNAQALHLIWAGEDHYGPNTLFFQAEDFIDLAKENPTNYNPPTVTFVFFNGVTSSMATALQELGIVVVGKHEPVSTETESRLRAIDDSSSEGSDDELEHLTKDKKLKSTLNDSDEKEGFGNESVEGEYVLNENDLISDSDSGEEDLNVRLDKLSDVTQEGTIVTTDVDPYSVPKTVIANKSENQRVFLDISTMIAMTSALCNGHCNYIFQDKILSEQAEREREEPLLPTVEPFLKDKELYTCEMAANDFRNILDVMGGPSEKERGEKLLKRLKIVPDDASKRSLALRESASIKSRSKIIFGTGDSLQAITCSANSGFVRAAAGQGINFVVHLHQSRALTEAKQAAAIPIDS